MLSGARYVVRGFGLWRTRPGLMLLGMVPALLVAAAVLALFVVLLHGADDVAGWTTPFADRWDRAPRDLLRGGVALLLVLGFVVLAAVTFTGVTLAVGDPFYERIWRETEAMLGGPVPQDDVGFWSSVGDSARLVGLGAVTALVVVAVGFVPVVGTVGGLVAGVLVSGRLLATELVARPLGARGMDREARRALFEGRRGALLGFGVTTQVFFLVPLGAVVVMPAAVAGATMLARDTLQRRR